MGRLRIQRTHSGGEKYANEPFSILPPNLRPSLPLLRTLAALRLLARKASVGVISRSTMLLSHGVRAALRSAGGGAGGDGQYVSHFFFKQI